MITKIKDSSTDILERALATGAQAAAATIIATVSLEGVDLSWLMVVVCTAGAAFLSVLKGSIASQFGDKSASLLSEIGVTRDPATGRFVSRRISYQAEEVKRNGD